MKISNLFKGTTGAIKCALFAVAFIASTNCAAQATKGYKDVTLDSVFTQWNEITKTYNPGMSVLQFQPIHFFAKYTELPRPCDTTQLHLVFRLTRQTELLEKSRVSSCIKLTSEQGRTVSVWVQDVLIPGLKQDVKLGAQIEIYATHVAYEVAEDREKNMPLFVLNRFEPK